MKKLILIGVFSLTLIACERSKPLSQDQRKQMEKEEENQRMKANSESNDLTDAYYEDTTTYPNRPTYTQPTYNRPGYNYNRNQQYQNQYNSSTINYTPYDSSSSRSSQQDTGRSRLDTRARSGIYDPMNPANRTYNN
jgi:hypothetical protein